MNQTWPGGVGMGMAQGSWLYPPETLSNEFSVLSYVMVPVRLCPIHPFLLLAEISWSR